MAALPDCPHLVDESSPYLDEECNQSVQITVSPHLRQWQLQASECPRGDRRITLVMERLVEVVEAFFVGSFQPCWKLLCNHPR